MPSEYYEWAGFNYNHHYTTLDSATLQYTTHNYDYNYHYNYNYNTLH